MHGYRWILLLLAGCVRLATAAATAFVNVNVISMQSEHVSEARTVLVSNGRIAHIGAVDSTVLPDDALVIGGTDRYRLPGLAEIPLRDIENSRRVHGVMLRGQWLDRSALDKLLERYARTN